MDGYLRHTTQQIVMRFAVAEVVEATFGEMEPDAPRYNIAPAQPVDVVTESSPRVLERMRWGLVPSWAKDPSIGSRMINARAETLVEKPSFRFALTRRRCLVPADGFYEWKKQGKTKQPLHIRRKDGEIFAFAGLWDEWTSPGGSPLHSCTIITVEPNALMAAIHNRMPAILRREDEAAWPNAPGATAPELLSLLAPYPDEELEAYTVSTTVNSVAHDSPDCVKPVEAETDLTLSL